MNKISMNKNGSIKNKNKVLLKKYRILIRVGKILFNLQSFFNSRIIRFKTYKIKKNEIIKL